MDELFSCRNCIHNPSQNIFVGLGDGYCVQHLSVIQEPLHTTCKSLHRKDLPDFVVEEGVEQHREEYAQFPELVKLGTMEPVRPMPSMMKAAEFSRYEETLNLPGRRNILTEVGTDGRRSLIRSSLIRRWLLEPESAELIKPILLAMLEEIDEDPKLKPEDLYVPRGYTHEELMPHSQFNILMNRIFALQEYGNHAGIEELHWATDSLGDDCLIESDWHGLKQELSALKPKWREMIASQPSIQNGTESIIPIESSVTTA
jgi:hypothetical protein